MVSFFFSLFPVVGLAITFIDYYPPPEVQVEGYVSLFPSPQHYNLRSSHTVDQEFFLLVDSSLYERNLSVLQDIGSQARRVGTRGSYGRNNPIKYPP
jgi:hypothetical protein